MLLAIDIGNTNTVMGIFRAQKLVENWRLVSSHTRTSDEYWIIVKQLCQNARIDIKALKGVVISSVVPELTDNFSAMTRKYLQLNPLVVDHRLHLGLKLLVKEPETMGADRLCNIVAAKHQCPYPAIVIDLGTATTFEVLNTEGNYIGGAIAPGLYTASYELTRRAAQLYKISLEYPQKVIGTTTREHLQSGIVIGHLSMLEGMISKIERELETAVDSVITTGGFAAEMATYSPLIDRADPDLTLKGLAIIYANNS